MAKVQPLNPNIVLIDITTGRLTREGFQFFQALRADIAGDDQGSISLDDIEVFSFPLINVDSSASSASDEGFSFPIVSVIQDEASFPEIQMQPYAEIAALNDRIDDLEIGRVAP